MLRPRSIRTRLLLVVLATTATALVVAAVAMILYDLREYRQSLVTDLATQADIIGQSSLPALQFEDHESARETLSMLKAKPNIIAGALYNARGGLFARYERHGVHPGEVPSQPGPAGTHIGGEDVVLVRPIVENSEVLGTVYLRGEYEIGRHVRDYATIVGGALAVSLIAAVMVWMWLHSTITTPILEIRELVQKVVENRDYSLRARRVNDDEIGYLADAFNEMLAEIGSRTAALEASNASLAEEVREREIVQAALQKAEDDLRRLNAELEQRVATRTEELAAANKELESFSYSVSHDLRAPVRAIAGFSRLLGEQHEAQLDVEARRKLGIVRSEAARMGALIDDLLAFSRLGRQALQRKHVDMEELVRRNVETLNAGHHGTLPTVRVGPLPAAYGDRSVLAQVWANLLANAYKFSGKRERPAVEIGAVAKDGENVYFVRDNGVGFDPRFASKLFGVFQRLHDPADFPGTGVGLALVHRIVTRHGGRVWAEGQPDAGATFYFSLPQKEDHGAV